MSRTPLDLQPLPRPEMQRYAECAAEGCNREPRSFSRFCTIHARRFAETRDPNGRAVRRRELRPYVELAERYLERNSDHPAVVAAIEYLRASLTDETLPPPVRAQLQRLRLDAAEPRTMLVNFLAVWGLGHFLPHTVTSDACETFNLGNRVLRTTPMHSRLSGKGRRIPGRLPARVAETYGQILRGALGLFAVQFWRYVQEDLEAPARSAAALSTALREHPLGAA